MVNYYAIHVMSGRENKTRDLLLSRAVAQKQWQDTILDIIIPTEKEYITRRGKRVIADKKVFPGYIFVKMHLDENSEKQMVSLVLLGQVANLYLSQKEK
jgi:transcriptional antiterminator NusG